jgi:hypothetical protein
MRKASFIIFDDYVMGATASQPTFTSSKFHEVLGKFDRFALDCVVDNVSASTTLDVFVQHSPNGEQWLHANGAAENPPVAGQGNVSFGSLPTTQTNFKVGDSGANPLLAFVRLQLFLGSGTARAHVKITVTPRDTK